MRIQLWSSRWASVAGFLLMVPGILAVGAVGLFWYHSLRAEPPANQGLMIGGSVAATPGLVALGSSFAMNACRLFRRRRGGIEVLDGHLVIHDRWMLRRPMVIARVDVVQTERLPFEPAVWSLRQSGGRVPGLRESSALLDYGTTPNVAIHFRHARTFPEAVRTPPARVGFHPISRGRSASALLIRVTEPDKAVQALDEWMATSTGAGQPSAEAGCVDGCVRAIVVGLWSLVTIGGVVVYVVGTR